MVDLNYLKKKRRKKVASIVTLITGVLLIPFMLVSFMGRDIGHFTIGLKNNDVKLAMSTDIDFNESTTFISLDKLPPYSIYKAYTAPSFFITDITVFNIIFISIINDRLSI